MDAIPDLTWLRQITLSTVERLELKGFSLVLVSLPPTPAHHDERFRFRLLAFDPSRRKPFISIDLEHDILGEYCLCVQTGRDHRVLARYDDPPNLAEFRERALAELDQVLPALGSTKNPQGAARKRPRA